MIREQILSIDIETYSSVDLRKSGVYRYVEAEDFTVLMIAYAVNDEPVKNIDVQAGEDLSAFTELFFDVRTVRSAYNAQFERVCLNRFFKKDMSAAGWICTMVKALELGLPGTLEEVAKALKLDEQKDKQGKRLMRKYSKPNEHGKRNLPSDELVDTDWQAFMAYCVQDVEVERAIRKKLDAHALESSEWELYHLDQHINDMGVQVDPVLVAQAIRMNDVYCDRLEREAIGLTGMDNPNSLSQLKRWLKEAEGLEIETLNKQTLPDVLKGVQSDTARRVLEIRKELSKTSVMKYQAMHHGKCKDDRIRGLLQFYGAGRTGRWAGRMVQVQNLPGNKLKDLDEARQLVRSGNVELVEMLYGHVPDVLSQLIRTAFVPREGHRFIVADFSAIEARVIAWLAGEAWRLEVFETHGKIYEASAAQMFNVPIESIGKGSPLRQKGKVAELALGYQGGTNALVKMGALDMGLNEEELPTLVKTWRKANPAIVTLWQNVEHDCAYAIENPYTIVHCMLNKLVFTVKDNMLFIKLPSGRRLAYVQPKMQPHPKFEGREQIAYMGVDQLSRKWTRLATYGGKLVENIVQAIARDCLAESMKRLHSHGYRIVMHVHDEVVLEVPIGESSADEVADIMGKPIHWAEGLPLRADAFETDYYKKD